MAFHAEGGPGSPRPYLPPGSPLLDAPGRSRTPSEAGFHLRIQHEESNAMIQPPKNRICLWFDGDAEEAARFYAATFPNSSVDGVMHTGRLPRGEGRGRADEGIRCDASLKPASVQRKDLGYRIPRDLTT